MRQTIRKSQKQQNKLRMDIIQLKGKGRKDETPDEFNNVDEILKGTKTSTTKKPSKEVTKLRKEVVTHKEELCSELKSCVGRCEKEVSLLAPEMEEQHRTLVMKHILTMTKAIQAQVLQFGGCSHDLVGSCKQASDGDDMLEHEVSELQTAQPSVNQKLMDMKERLNVTVRSVTDAKLILKSFTSSAKAFRSSASVETTMLSESHSSSTLAIH